MYIKKIREIITTDENTQKVYNEFLAKLKLEPHLNRYEYIMPCILLTPAIMVAMADNHLSFFEQIFLESKIKNHNKDYDGIITVFRKIVKVFPEIEKEMMEIYKAIFNNKFYKKIVVDEMVEMAGVDGGFSSVGNAGLMLLTGLAGLGLGAKAYFQKMTSLSLAGSISKKELEKINEICRYLGVEEIKEDSSKLEELQKGSPSVFDTILKK